MDLDRIADREFRRFSHRFRERIKGVEDYQVYQEVLDRSTLLALYGLVRRDVISAMGGVVSTGKEAHLFHALGPGGAELAIKIYRTQTADFKFIRSYIGGDPRFQGIGSDRRKLILAWAQKEYSNLIRCHQAGVSVPRPIAILSNALVMEFIGQAGLPAPTLKQLEPQLDRILDPAQLKHQLIAELRKLYWKAQLVHADLSEYNIMYLEKPVLIDLGQALELDHPMAALYFERDLRNLANFLNNYVPCSQQQLKQSILGK